MGCSHDADDVVQDTFITAWAKLSTLKDSALVKNWLMRIASYKSIDRIRARRQNSNLDDVGVPASEDHSPTQIVEARSCNEALSQVFSALPEDQRQCWDLESLGTTDIPRSLRNSICPFLPFAGCLLAPAKL
nr:RNA polymerase sigma factor [Cryobacterium sp. Hz7]